MRVLLTASPVPSHYHILIPYALALREAGHSVALASGPNIVPSFERLGFQAFNVGPPLVPRTTPPTDPAERLKWAWEEYFVGAAAVERLRDLVQRVESWGPDLIVRENSELAGCIAAEAAGLPHAAVQLGNLAATLGFPRDLLRGWLDELRATQALPPDPDLGMLFRYLLLLSVPPSFHDPSIPLPTTAQFVQPVNFDTSGDEHLPDWVEALPARPTVCMSLGTVYNKRVDLFALVIEALRDDPINLIVTVGRDQDPAQFGPQPGNVRIERYIPLSLLLPKCQAMINCGGMSSLKTAFEHAVPLILLPLGADHPYNAARCQTLGVARVLDPRTATAPAVREAVHAVLSEPAYRLGADRLRKELMALPGVEFAVQLLERLALTHAGAQVQPNARAL